MALSVIAAAASAGTINLTYDGPSAGDTQKVNITSVPSLSPEAWNPQLSTDPNAGDTQKVNITSVPSLSPEAASGNQWAYGFNMTTDSSRPLDQFMAWCLDLQYYLGISGEHQYRTTNTPFSSTLDLGQDGRGDRIQDVFDANYGSVDTTDGDEAAGFQLALWEALYDDDLDLGNGDFQASDREPGAQTAFDFGADYLAAADGYGDGKRFNLTFLESTPFER